MGKAIPQRGFNPRSLPVIERLKLRLRTVEHRQMPDSVRQRLVSYMADPFERTAKLDDGRELIFIHVPKTGGTSLAEAMGVQCGHIPVSRYKFRNADRFSKAFSFAFVRNPWDRLFSSFGYLRSAFGINASRDVLWAEENLARFDTFEEFVLGLKDARIRNRILPWIHFRPQVDWLTVPNRSGIPLDFLGRFENLESEAKTLGNALGMSFTVPHLRKPQKYREDRQFTPEMVDIVGEIYAADAKQFGYTAPES